MAEKAVSQKKKEGKKKARKLISVYTILLLLLVVIAVISWILSVLKPGVITPATFSDVVMAPMIGFKEALDIIIYLIVIGGFLALVEKTGALRAGIAALVKALNGRELVLIPILMILFSVLGSTYGFCEESLGFIGILAATMLAAGFDTLVAVMVVLLGAGVGCMCCTVNPFAVGVATSTLNDTFAGLGISATVSQVQVIGIGLLLLVVSDAIVIPFVYHYAKKVKFAKGSILSPQEMAAAERDFGKVAKFASQEEAKGVQFEPVADIENAAGGIPAVDSAEKQEIKNIERAISKEKVTKKEEAAALTITPRQIAVLITFAFAFIVMIIAFVPWSELGIDVFNGWSAGIVGMPLGEWSFLEAASWFFLMSLVVIFLSGMSEKEGVEGFVEGAADMMGVAIIIALARAISVLMSSTGIADWFLTAASNRLAGTSPFLFAPLSWLVMDGLSFLIPSSSGLATMSMPIMGPLAHNLGFSAAVIIQIYSSANGFMNLFVPTAVAIMGGLAIAHVEYSTWLKHVMKVVAVLAVVVLVILTASLYFLPA